MIAMQRPSLAELFCCELEQEGVTQSYLPLYFIALFFEMEERPGFKQHQEMLCLSHFWLLPKAVGLFLKIWGICVCRRVD